MTLIETDQRRSGKSKRRSDEERRFCCRTLLTCHAERRSNFSEREARAESKHPEHDHRYHAASGIFIEAHFPD
jgi:hypothetical protein